MKKLISLFILIIFILSCKTYTVTFYWQHTTNPTNVDGFKVYCGRYSRQYTATFDLGKVVYKSWNGTIANYSTSRKFSDPSYKNYKYCAMTAYRGTKESGYSNEVSWQTVEGISTINFVCNSDNGGEG